MSSNKIIMPRDLGYNLQQPTMGFQLSPALLRDFFAGLAMSGIKGEAGSMQNIYNMLQQTGEIKEEDISKEADKLVAVMAYDMADTMLTVRELSKRK